MVDGGPRRQGDEGRPGHPGPPPHRPARIHAEDENVATLVRARHLLTASDPAHLRDAAVAIDGARILAVGPWDRLRRELPDAAVIGDGTGILMPGLVNCHGHFSEGLITGIGEEWTLVEWIEGLILPVAPHITREMARVGTVLMGGLMVLSGVTTVNDMFVCTPGESEPVTPGVVEGLEAIGLRGEVSFGAQDRAYPYPVETFLAEHDALADAAARSRRSRFRVGIATVLSQSEPLFRASVARAVGRGEGAHIHLHETREEITATQVRFRERPIARAARLGLFEAQVIAAHCVWLDDQDIATLAQHGVSVSHNAVSNMILGSGVSPIRRLRREGIAVGLGTDGPASNDGQDMLETLKVTSLLQRVHHLQATAITARQVIEMATIGGARALGLDERTGSIEVGKEADLVLLGADSPSLLNVHDPYQAVVYCARSSDVSDVWVEGERIVKDHELTRVDLRNEFARAHELASELASASGIDSELSR